MLVCRGRKIAVDPDAEEGEAAFGGAYAVVWESLLLRKLDVPRSVGGVT